MADEVCTALGIDEEDFEYNFIVVEEQNGVDAKFVLSCIMAYKLRNNAELCLVTLHNAFAHYQNVGSKLGYNLQQQRENGSVEVIEFLQMVNNDWICSDNDDEKTGCRTDALNAVKSLFFKIKEKVGKLAEKQKPICLIIDDLSSLLNVGISVELVWYFTQYCRSLLSIPDLLMVILTHVDDEDKEQKMIAAMLGHVGDMRVEVAGLKTGQSINVSGFFTIRRRDDYDEEPELTQDKYHFKLADRQVKVFAPGSLS